MKSRTTLLFVGLSLLLVALFALDLAVGSVRIPLSEVWSALTGAETATATAKIVRSIRLMKAVVAVVAGAALAVSGLQMQTLLTYCASKHSAEGLGNTITWTWVL